MQRGLGSEADWGIVNGQANSDGRIIGAVGNPSDKNRLRRADFCHLPLHKGGKGAVRTQRRHPVGGVLQSPANSESQ